MPKVGATCWKSQYDACLFAGVPGGGPRLVGPGPEPGQPQLVAGEPGPQSVQAVAASLAPPSGTH